MTNENACAAVASDIRRAYLRADIAVRRLTPMFVVCAATPGEIKLTQDQVAALAAGKPQYGRQSTWVVVKKREQDRGYGRMLEKEVPSAGRCGRSGESPGTQSDFETRGHQLEPVGDPGFGPLDVGQAADRKGTEVCRRQHLDRVFDENQ